MFCKNQKSSSSSSPSLMVSSPVKALSKVMVNSAAAVHHIAEQRTTQTANEWLTRHWKSKCRIDLSQDRTTQIFQSVLLMKTFQDGVPPNQICYNITLNNTSDPAEPKSIGVCRYLSSQRIRLYDDASLPVNEVFFSPHSDHLSKGYQSIVQ